MKKDDLMIWGEVHVSLQAICAVCHSRLEGEQRVLWLKGRVACME